MFKPVDLFGLLLLASIAALATGCASLSKETDMSRPALAPLDLPRFMGRWWVIANIPYFAERGKVASSDNYTLRADGGIDVVYAYRKSFEETTERTLKASARPLEGSGGAHWKQRFFGVLSVQLQVLEVDPEYRWALIGNPKRSLAWVFAREPQMDATTYLELAERLRPHGYDPADLLRIPQAPAQAGQPGFQ
jgi:apolipoprotein D and lipocalin family protein